MTYFMVVCRVKVQNMHDNPPKIRSVVMIRSAIIALKTYSGEVQKIIYEGFFDLTRRLNYGVKVHLICNYNKSGFVF